MQFIRAETMERATLALRNLVAEATNAADTHDYPLNAAGPLPASTSKALIEAETVMMCPAFPLVRVQAAKLRFSFDDDTFRADFGIERKDGPLDELPIALAVPRWLLNVPVVQVALYIHHPMHMCEHQRKRALSLYCAALHNAVRVGFCLRDFQESTVAFVQSVDAVRGALR